MNIIGIVGTKVLALLAVWIPSYSVSEKLVLTGVCAIKLFWDYDRSRPGHKGFAYKLTSRASVNVQDVIVSVIGLIISATFAFMAVAYATWIPVVAGILSAAISLFELVSNLKDMKN